MRDVRPLLNHFGFPAVRRDVLETVQVNVGLRCNQQCLHCHVSASPRRTEQMDHATAQTVLDFLAAADGVHTLDVTGGAPELNANFRFLVRGARRLGLKVIDRCNLTILEEPDQQDLAEFLAQQQVEVVASLPCYLQENVDRQRGTGVFAASLKGLRRLNRLGYGRPGSGLVLDLVYNPQDRVLPPPQDVLEKDYKRELRRRYQIEFNHLYTLCNMPVGRFGSALASRGEFNEYMQLLHDAHRPANLGQVMCRTLLSVDWRGYVYDCDFNQMLDLPMRMSGARHRPHLSELLDARLEGRAVNVRDHCYGCTAGNGSSCGGALSGEAASRTGTLPASECV